MAKLLIVDDDQILTSLIKQEMEKQGWMVETAYTFNDGRQFLECFSFDLIVLDWSLPDGTGLTLCRNFRRAGGTTPVIFLTGRNDIDSKESGLDSGGDEFLTKPFDIRELLAHVRAIQRRPTHFIQDALIVKGITLDTRLSRLTGDEIDVKLSPTELALLEYLFRHQDQIFSGADLFRKVWPANREVQDDTIRVHLHILRRKLAVVGLKDFIKTVRGSGYILESR
ncbi:MAG: hypothetical protein C0473_02225 [Cyanobacteria bacterium DS3.002]|nr:hypothetical protein [Cyanobacteria bacterium DS3.002]MBA4049629.1 hypothetical protein [Cyanobacteria bacterium DS2.008]MBA4073406.1 hypothetical protein [Cyanobacteria bacterium PR.023]